MPKTAITKRSPGRASRVSTTGSGVESGDDRPAGVAERVRQLAVHPDLGVVVATTSKTTVEPAMSVSPIRSGSVTAMRYQLKHTRPFASGASCPRAQEASS